MSTKPIGRVSATEKQPSTCTSVRFWVEDSVRIRPFDVVRVKHVGTTALQESYSYAMVRDLEYISDSAGHLANFVSSDFGDLDSQPFNLRMGTTVAEADVLYNTADVEMPIRDGAQVEWADANGIREALGLNAFEKGIPAGYLSVSNGEQVSVELESDYLLGPEGAHLNISGISGLATKTSYAMFLLSAIQQRLEDDATIVIFNVKGDDLMYLDVPTDVSSSVVEDWRRCGLEPRPFKNVAYLTPYSRRCENFTDSSVDSRIMANRMAAGTASNYYYDVETAQSRLDLLFSDIDDPNSTMESIVHELPEFDAVSWDEFRSQVQQKTEKGGAQNKNISVMSWRKFARLLRARTMADIFTEKSAMDAPKKRQTLVRDAVRKLKRGGVLVVDVQPLPDYLQLLVFGDVIKTLYDIKLGDEEDGAEELGKVVIFADELNKYAPKGSSDASRTLTRYMLEVTERGRSLGIVLFGAEQFRSGVHERVLGNCSTNVFGRTSPVELGKGSDYRYFPSTYKSAITRLPKGSLLLQHAVFKTDLVKVRFPMPAYHQPKR